MLSLAVVLTTKHACLSPSYGMQWPFSVKPATTRPRCERQGNPEVRLMHTRRSSKPSTKLVDLALRRKQDGNLWACSLLYIIAFLQNATEFA